MRSAIEESPLEEVARRAIAGDRGAVAALIRGLEGPIHALALRMLWHPQDAEDATQEILVRVVTHLSQFDFRSRLKTWAYRVAANHLIDIKRSCVEREQLTFAGFAQDLLQGISDAGPSPLEDSILTEEVRVGCTLAMLQCLDRPHRIAYILGEIFDLPAPEAAEALSLEPAAFRKRLQRAREAVEQFTRAQCGLVSDDAPCGCHRRVPVALKLGRVSPDCPLFAEQGESFVQARDLISRVERVQRVVELQRRAVPSKRPTDVARLVIATLASE